MTFTVSLVAWQGEKGYRELPASGRLLCGGTLCSPQKKKKKYKPGSVCRAVEASCWGRSKAKNSFKKAQVKAAKTNTARTAGAWKIPDAKASLHPCGHIGGAGPGGGGEPSRTRMFLPWLPGDGPCREVERGLASQGRLDPSPRQGRTGPSLFQVEQWPCCPHWGHGLEGHWQGRVGGLSKRAGSGFGGSSGKPRQASWKCWAGTG